MTLFELVTRRLDFLFGDDERVGGEWELHCQIAAKEVIQMVRDWDSESMEMRDYVGKES